MKKICEINQKYGKLTVISEPYYVNLRGHNRQHVDCKCDCGNLRLKINCLDLKNENIIFYCSKKCSFYLDEKINNKKVPDANKKFKIGDKINKLTVIKEAYYHRFNNRGNRYKVIDLQCDCGNIKTYREINRTPI